MGTVDVLYSEVNIISLIIMFIVLIKSLGFSRMESRKNFVFSMVAQIVFAFSDTLFVLFYRNILPYNGFFLILFKSIYFISTVGMAFSWYLYFQVLQGSTILYNRSKIITASVPVLIVVYIVIGNLFNHSLFYINESGQYTRGPWFFTVQYLFPVIYIYFICSNSIRCAYNNRHVPEGKLYLIQAVFPLIPTITSYIQIFFPDYPLTNIAIAFVTLLVYVNSMDDAVSVDPLTQLPNRRQFMKQLNRWFGVRNEANPAYFMILDVDKFKHVNDEYGHTEGDAALVRVAESLKAACTKQRKKSVVARYGGDEFMLLVEAICEDEIKKLIIQIERTLKENDEAANSPYRLSVSAGYARLDEERTIKAVIDLADERQYEVKKIHHRIIEENGAKPK